MAGERPDLTGVPAAVRAYIEALEVELARLRPTTETLPAAAEPSEPPTTLNVITISAAGVAKRTPRHLYGRQHRGGMGVFDLETPEDDPPAFLTAADEAQCLVLITSLARVFRLPVGDLPESPVRSRGVALPDRLPLLPGERLASVVPDLGQPYLAVLSERGFVRWLVGHLVNERMRPGTPIYEPSKVGRPVSACWAPSRGDVLIVTRRGMAIRFSTRLLPLQGCALGVRPERDDSAVAIAAVDDESGVLLLGADGRATVRLMSGFRAQKSLGTAGKLAIKSEAVVSALTAHPDDDLFIVSRLGKIIRFEASEIPPKEGVVQGVNCLALRADAAIAAVASPRSALVQEE